jgi:hypothetical protein
VLLRFVVYSYARSSPNTGHGVSQWRHKKAPLLMQQMLRMRLGVPTLTPTLALDSSERTKAFSSSRPPTLAR